MVEYSLSIDDVFTALADPIRRDILERVHGGELSVNQIALDYDVSVAAISKHLKILHEVGLIQKRRQGRYIMVRTRPDELAEATAYLAQFAADQTARYNSSESVRVE